MPITRKWSVHDAFRKAICATPPAVKSTGAIFTYGEGEEIPIEVWEETLIKAAGLVDRWGASYLPIFERVEQELEKKRKQLASLEKARHIASGNTIDISPPSRDQRYLFKP